MKRDTRNWLIGLAVAVVLIGAYIFWIQSNKPKVTEGEYPVTTYENSKNADRTFLEVNLDEDAKLSDVVKMSYFEPLTPEDDQQTAVDKLGFPANTRETDGGEKIMEFQREGYRLEVGMAEESTEERDIYFNLRSFPVDASIFDVLPDSVIDRISDEDDDVTVSIKGEGQAVFVIIEGQRVKYIQWQGYD